MEGSDLKSDPLIPQLSAGEGLRYPRRRARAMLLLTYIKYTPVVRAFKAMCGKIARRRQNQQMVVTQDYAAALRLAADQSPRGSSARGRHGSGGGQEDVE